MNDAPSVNGFGGRGADGKFLPGNRLGRGNPHGRRVNELRNAMLAAVSHDDVEAIIGKLIEAAKAGDTVAAREVLDRIIGKPAQSDVLARLEALEDALDARNDL